VRKAGQRVRITGQLIDGATGGHLWADRYDRDLTDIFAVQDDITRTIIAQLQVRLLADESRALHQTPTRNAEAYGYYLRGRRALQKRGLHFLRTGREMFARAVELDPGYGRAYAGIADCESRMNEWFGERLPVDHILAMADKALQLEPDLPEGHAARGLALEIGGRGAEAPAAYERALALDPACYEAHHSYGRWFFRAGDMEACAHHFLRALEIQPDDYHSPLLLVGVFDRLGRQDEREKYLDLGLKRAQAANRMQPEHTDPLELGAAVLAGAGRHDMARDWLQRAQDSKTGPRTGQGSYNILCTYALLGERDLALVQLEAMVRAQGSGMLNWASIDPDLDSLRDDPRFAALLNELH